LSFQISLGTVPHVSVLSSLLAATYSEVVVTKKILIIDDHPNIRRLVREFIERQTGLEVCGEAVDGLDGLQKASSLDPDLIILDFQMPKMNGLEAARLLTQILPSVPIILFTMHIAILPVAALAGAGIKAVVSKMDSLDILADHALRLLALDNAPIQLLE
jgi:DNA-binding NarL/FixJ family response regulator